MKNMMTINRLLTIALIALPSTVFGTNPVENWWQQCHGGLPNSTCLTDEELSKFKTICSKKENKLDCKRVVDYSVSKARLEEGKYFLKVGYASQQVNYTTAKSYLNSVEKTAIPNKIINEISFAYGMIPSCKTRSKAKLVFSPYFRDELEDLKNEFSQTFENLVSSKCAEIKKGFILVAIGKVSDSSDQIEILTIDETKNIKSIRSAVALSPFEQYSHRIAAHNEFD